MNANDIKILIVQAINEADKTFIKSVEVIDLEDPATVVASVMVRLANDDLIEVRIIKK